jgi:hypothetical protein
VTGDEAVGLACRAFGADPAATAVLRASDAITVDLADGRVARIVPDADADAERVIAALPLLGGHVLEPLAPPVRLDGGIAVAYPRVAPGLDGRDDLAMGGACLAGLHRIDADDLDLPVFDPRRLAERWLDRQPDVLLAHERDRLLADIDAAWPAVTGATAVLHGDAHPANWWVAREDWWVLIDPEFLSVGPAVYDLAPLEVVERRLGLGPSRFPSFLAGYESAAGPVDPAALDAAIRVRELLAVAWLAARAADSATALQVRQRLEGREGSWLA